MGLILLHVPIAIKYLAVNKKLSDIFEFILVKSPFLVSSATLASLKKNP